MDPFAALSAALKSSYTGSTGYRPPSLGGGGWGSGFSLGTPSKGWGSFGGGVSKTPPVGTPPPERFDVKLPMGAAPQAPQPSTQGDVFGSIGSAIGNLQTTGLNIGNAIPWFMERIGVAAHEMAASDVPVVKQAGQLAGVATDGFLGAVQTASDVVGPVLEAIPNFYRDQQLEDRARLYRSIVTGEDPGLTGQLTIGGLMRRIPQAGTDFEWERKYASFKAYADLYRQTKGSDVSPQELAELVDLPEDVMARIRENPNGDLNKYLDQSEEGRRFSYRFGPVSTIADFGYTGALYIGELALAPVAAAGAIRAIPGAAEALTATRVVPGIGRATTIAGAVTKPFTIAARMQSLALRSGLGIAGLTTAGDVVARYQGNQAAIDWFDKVNREHPISDNPHVQLVTSFTVNPLDALKAARTGVVRLSTGAGDVFVGKVLGREVARVYTHQDVLDGLVQKMYRLGDRTEARLFIDEKLGGRGVALDHVLGYAGDTVVSKLSAEERVMFRARHPDGLDQTKAVFETYGAEIADLMKNHADELVARVDYAWQYHDFTGPFSPDIAALVARDSRGALIRNYEFRQQLDAVQGYTELIPPSGQELARSWVNAAGDMIPLNPTRGGAEFSVNGLIAKMPAFRKYKEGLVPPGATSVPKATLETMLDRASAEYALTAKTNPIRARTGADPILRPNSPTPVRDLADALGVDETTADALLNVNTQKPKGEHVEPLRRYLVDHADLSEADVAAMTPTDVATRAAIHAADRAEPWRAAGTRLAEAETRLGAIDKRMMAIHANERSTLLGMVGARRTTLPEQVEFHELTAERRVLAELVASAQTHTTFAEALSRSVGKGEQLAAPARQAVMEAAVRKVDAMRRLDELSAISEAVKPAADALALDPADLLAAMRKVDGEWRFGPEAADTLAPDLVERLRSAVMGLHERNVPPVRTTKRMSPASIARKEQVRRQKVTAISNQFLDAPAAALVADVRRSKVLRDRLRVEDPELAAAIDALGPEASASPTGRMIDEKVAAALGVETADEASAVIGRYREAADAILDPKYSLPQNTARLRRTAGMNVPEGYVASLTERIVPLHADPVGEIAHLDAIERVRLAIVNGTYEAIAPTVERDARLRAAVEDAAERLGVDANTMLTDSAFAAEVRKAVVPAGWKPRIPGAEETPLDAAITSGDPANLSPLMEQVRTALDEPPPPITGVTPEAAAAVIRPVARQSVAYNELSRQINALRDAKPTTVAAYRANRRALADLVAERARTERWETSGPVDPPSTVWRRKILARGGDTASEPSAAILADPANAQGLRVLSLLDHGSLEGPPVTVGQTIELLKVIEKGYATRIGVGLENAAEAQRVATAILHQAEIDASTQGIAAGVFTTGVHPAMLPPDELALARKLLGEPGTKFEPNSNRPMMTYDPDDPLGSLQYGLKRRPKDAVVIELSQVPGLAEEFMTKHFQPWEERVYTARTRQAFNWLFGKHGNREIAEQTHTRFIEAASQQGVDTTTSQAIWDAWAKTTRESHFGGILRKSPTGERTYRSAEGRLYGSPRNIPNRLLDEVAHGSDTRKGAIELELAGGRIANETARAYAKVDFARVFRDAAAPLVLREWQASKIPLGDLLTGMYGAVTGNRWVSFAYHQFRFALDLRYHAMNAMESKLLYLGRAALRPGEIDKGMFGLIEETLKQIDADPMGNAGYAAGRDRAAYLFKTILKEQPDTIRKTLRGLQTEDPALIERALKELAAYDPQLRDMLEHMGHDPTKYMKEMDGWYQRMLGAADDAETGQILDEALVPFMRADPAMAEVYGHIRQANAELMADARSTFYGNAERSRAERFLNSYVLYWPLSYQIKSAKWLTKVLFDRAGGLKTNAAGAWLVNDMAEKHQTMLANDPEYQAWFAKHKTLVFMAQMLLPITPDSMGVSLNPIMRDLFFNRHKDISEIGPIYTIKLADQIVKELYPDLGAVPEVRDSLYRMTGRTPPKQTP